MNRTLKHIIGCLATLAMVVAGARRLGFLLRPVSENNTDYAFTQVDTFYSLPDNCAEVIIYGSSHAFRNVDPMPMYDQYGIGAYNYSWHWQKLDTTKLFLQDSLISQSPRVALIETYFVDRIVRSHDMDGETYYTRYLRNSKYKFQYLKGRFGNNPERWLSYFMPLAVFHDNWPNLSKGSFSEIVNYHRYRMGFGASKGGKPIKLPDPSEVKQRRLKKWVVAELDSIVEICRAHGMDVVFFTAPFADGFRHADAMAEFARERGCAYINLLDHVAECGLDAETDFKDRGHLNSNGAAKISAFLGKYLSEHYDLTDMRTIADNPWARAETSLAQ